MRMNDELVISGIGVSREKIRNRVCRLFMSAESFQDLEFNYKRENQKYALVKLIFSNFINNDLIIYTTARN